MAFRLFHNLPHNGIARGLRSPSVHLYFVQTRSSLDLFMKPEEGLRTLAKILGIKLPVPTHSSENASYGADLLRMWCKTMITALSKIDPIMGPQIIGSPLLKGYENISDNRDAVASFGYSSLGQRIGLKYCLTFFLSLWSGGKSFQLLPAKCKELPYRLRYKIIGGDLEMKLSRDFRLGIIPHIYLALLEL